MIKVGSYYIEIEHIKSIHYENNYMVITYFFDNIPVRIPVANYEAFDDEVYNIIRIRNIMKVEENVDKN